MCWKCSTAQKIHLIYNNCFSCESKFFEHFSLKYFKLVFERSLTNRLNLYHFNEMKTNGSLIFFKGGLFVGGLYFENKINQ